MQAILPGRSIDPHTTADEMIRGSNLQVQEPRTRQACEPCRRKKRKCTGEKPVCSFCRRLGQDCVYLPRGHLRTTVNAAKVSKPSTSESSGIDRFRRLEIQVQDIQQMLQQQVGSPNEPRTGVRDESEVDHSSIVVDTSHSTTARIRPSSFTLAQSMPPAAVLDHLVDVYRTIIHLQPVPLFGLDDLRSRLVAAPLYLLWAFLALTVNFSDHEFYHEKKAEAIDFYTSSAENTAMDLALDGVPKLEVEQCLCLLVMKHILARKPARAWMAMGMASRLETLRMKTQRDARLDKDNISRCYWSIFVLERTFFPQLAVALEPGAPGPEYTISAPAPPVLPSRGDDSDPFVDALDRENATKDLGINVYYANWLLVWADVARYLHGIRLGDVEVPWSLHSSYMRVNAKLCDCECGMPDRHLLRFVGFHKRAPQELLAHQDYWRPWIAMQLISHAATALVNHPLIHLSATRRARAPQSRHFLQQTIDQALFHSGWVFRLIQMCEDVVFELHDPLVAHLAAATATIPWLFQFAMDDQVSERAAGDLRRCDKLLRRMSATWPHLAEKVELLDTLQSLACARPHATAEQSRHVTLPLAELWALLDPDIVPTPPGAASGPTSEAGARRAACATQDASMRITTHAVHPLVERGGAGPATPVAGGGGGLAFEPDAFAACPAEQLGPFSIDDLFSQFAPDTFHW